jgi:DNA-binding transcriptional ArsR family regulator
MQTAHQLDRIFAAVADPTRRAILHRLTKGDARVTEVAQPFAISLNAVSKHIRILEGARLVRRQRRGREHILSFCPAAFQQAEKWIESQRAVWVARLNALDALLHAEEGAASSSLTEKGAK